MITTTKANIKQHRHSDIDVGKVFFDIYNLVRDRHWQIHSTGDETKQLAKTRKHFNLTRIIAETTEGNERQAVEVLAETETPVIFVRAMNIQMFVKAQGVLAKADKIDARIIAQFDAIRLPEVRPIISNKGALYQRYIGPKAATDLKTPLMENNSLILPYLKRTKMIEGLSAIT